MVRKNLKITKDAHNILKEYCDKKYLKMSEWVSNFIITEINKLQKKDGKDTKE
jgi:hypothetical protein|tara:strand:+ start:329 stop:487 length:159 start_codon:yes stop_codon:yes gene_type:complete